jgi:hypothetical protein
VKRLTAVSAYSIDLHQIGVMVPPRYPADIRAEFFLLSVRHLLKGLATLHADLPSCSAKQIIPATIRFDRAKWYTQLTGNPAIPHTGASKLYNFVLYAVSHAYSLLPRFYHHLSLRTAIKSTL